MSESRLLKMSEEFRNKLKSKNRYSRNEEYGVEHTSTLSSEERQNRKELKSKNTFTSNNQYGVSEE